MNDSNVSQPGAGRYQQSLDQDNLWKHFMCGNQESHIPTMMLTTSQTDYHARRLQKWITTSQINCLARHLQQWILTIITDLDPRGTGMRGIWGAMWWLMRDGPIFSFFSLSTPTNAVYFEMMFPAVLATIIFLFLVSLVAVINSLPSNIQSMIISHYIMTCIPCTYVPPNFPC